MNITRLNFRENLSFIRQCLQASHCYAFDVEMTGIVSSDLLRNSILDSFQSRYMKVKSNIETFLPVQLGLCGFKQLDSRSHEACPFNFYIYPFVLVNNAQDRVFSFSSGSMKFLAENNYDFNKLFYEGITYISREERKMYEGEYRLDKIRKALKDMDKIMTPDMRAFEMLHRQRIVKWLKSTSKEELSIPIKNIKTRIYSKLIESVREEDPNLQFYESYDKESHFERQLMTLSKTPTNKQEQAATAESSDEHLWLPELVEGISLSKKPVIVHNGFLDLMHVLQLLMVQIYHKFVGKLPDHVDEYKHRLGQLFPNIYDTKYLSSNSVVLSNKLDKDTSLKNCFQRLSKEQEPKISIHERCSDYSLGNKDAQYHEAGYDALITGLVHLKATHLVEQMCRKQNISFAETMKFFVNRVPLGGVQYPFNLAEKGDNYSSGHVVFHVQSIICTPVKQADIQAYFEQQYGRINIFWTARHVLNFSIQFQNKDKQSLFQRHLQQQGGISTLDISKTKFLVFTGQRYAQFLRGASMITAEQPNPMSKP